MRACFKIIIAGIISGLFFSCGNIDDNKLRSVEQEEASNQKQSSQLTIEQARKTGKLFESLNGYLVEGIDADKNLLALMKQINRDRQIVYNNIATRNGVLRRDVELMAGKRLVLLNSYHGSLLGASNKEILEGAKRSCLVFEGEAGYLKAHFNLAVEIKTLVDQVNEKRKSVYQIIALRTGVSIREIELIAGQKLLRLNLQKGCN